MRDKSGLVRSKTILAVAILGVVLLLPSVARSQKPTNPKRFLVLYWSSKDFPANIGFDEAFQAVLQSSEQWTEYYAEYLDPDRFPDERQSEYLHQYLRQKYAHYNIDVVVAVGDPPLNFLLKYRQDLFSSSAMVFISNKAPSAAQLALGPGLTGFVSRNSYEQTLELALRCHPDTEEVYVVSGSLRHDKAYENACRHDLEGYEGKASINYLTDLPPDELTAAIRDLPRRSILMYIWQQGRDADGKLLESEYFLGAVVRAASVPIYGISSWQIGRGVIGGYVRTLEINGTSAAEAALRIANGERAQDIAVESVPIVPMFDWRELRRWGLGDNRLPAGSIVRFRQPTIWEQYRWRIVGLVTILLVQTLFIALLLVERRRRRQSDANYHSIFNSVSDAIFVHDIESSRIVDVNRVMCEMYGAGRSEIESLSLRDLIASEPPYSCEAARDRLRKAVQGEPQIFECRAKDKAGRPVWVDVSLKRSLIGGRDRVIGVVRDITERKQAAQALHQSEERRRDILRALPDLMFLQTPDGVYLEYHANNPAELYVEPDHFLGRSASDVLPRELAEQLRPLLRRAHETGELQLLEYNLPIGGEDYWFEARIVSSGENVLSVVRNITDRKRAEEALRNNRMQLAGIIDSAMDGIISIDDRQRIVLMNPAAEQIFGYSARDAVGKTLDFLISGRFREEHQKHMRAFGETRVTTQSMHGRGDLWGIRADGTQFPIEASISQVVLNGRTFYTAMVRDITKRKRAEEALRESEQRFRTMADTAPVMIWVSGVDKHCTYFNQRWLEFTGRTLEQELGYGWADGVHPDDLPRCLGTYNEGFDLGQPFTMEYRLRRADGEFRWVYDSGTPRLSVSGEFLGFIGSCIDITDRKRAEQALADLSGQLIRAREDERARIARDLHDDLSQRIALISVELEQVSQKPARDNGDLRTQLQQVIAEVGELSGEIRRMSHDLHPSRLVHLGLVATLSDLADETRKNHGIKVEFRPRDVPPALPGEVSLCLYRIAQECLNNVIKHSGAGEALVELIANGNEILLRVSDEGRGFEVGSARNHGGLGLLSMRERLRLVGGEIHINSHPDRGTQIEASVPLGHKGERSTSSPGEKSWTAFPH